MRHIKRQHGFERNSINHGHYNGAGAKSREQIDRVIVVGMSFGTLLTLFIVPAFYMLITKDHKQPTH